MSVLCPNRSSLAEYLWGTISPDELESIAAHLGTCRTCGAVVEEIKLTTDPLVEDLRRTPDYMAPEQLVDSREVDGRADVYALGATLFELLTGRPPLVCEKQATLAQKILATTQGSLLPITGLRPDLPKPLAGILETMLAKDRDARPASPADVAKAIRPFAAGHDLPGIFRRIRAGKTETALSAAAKPPLPTKIRTGRSWKTLLAALAAALLLVLAAIIVRFQTAEGTLVVEISEPDVTVQVLSREGNVWSEQPAGKGTATIKYEQRPETRKQMSGESAIDRADPWKGPFAGVQVAAGCHFVPLESDAAITTSEHAFHWAEIPPEFKGFRFLRNEELQGTTKFQITRPSGMVLMAIPATRYGGRGGDWQKEIVTRTDLVSQGWREVGKLNSYYQYDRATLDWDGFARDCQTGETFSYRTEKYLAPVLVLE